MVFLVNSKDHHVIMDSYDSWALLENGIHPHLKHILAPNGILRKCRHPLCELNIVITEMLCVSGESVRKPSKHLLYTVASASSWAISSTVIGLWCSLMMALFKLLGSRHTLTSPFRFIRNVTDETHGVSPTCSVMISSIQ